MPKMESIAKRQVMPTTQKTFFLSVIAIDFFPKEYIRPETINWEIEVTFYFIINPPAYLGHTGFSNPKMCANIFQLL